MRREIGQRHGGTQLPTRMSRSNTISLCGPGSVLSKPDQTGRREVVIYLFALSQIIVNQGDDVTLEFIGVNGKSHPITIAAYDKSFEQNRGQVTKISLEADNARGSPLSATLTNCR